MNIDQHRASSEPKVLIFSQTFNSISGGGITLSNLFSGYPKENLAVLSYPFMLFNVSFDICDTYYQIGRDEYVWRYPFSLFKKTYDSGVIVRKDSGKTDTVPKLSLRNRLSSNILTPFVRWLGLSHCISEITISEQLKRWLDNYLPEVLYLQISNRESILFSLKLQDYLKIPIVIHMMDDWPSTISSLGPMNKLWKNRIDREFRILLGRAALCLSISDAMAEEYLSRYGRKFIPFHNPIDVNRFEDIKPFYTSFQNIKILYLGRIGTANHNSILKFAYFVSSFCFEDHKLELHIYTKDNEHPYVHRLKKLQNVFVRPPVHYGEVPDLMTKYDLLLLPLDFSASGQRFSRLSMPTKASEYMMSGIPMLVFAPANTAISKFCMKYQCGHCITDPDIGKLRGEIIRIVSDLDYRRDLGRRARTLAQQLFNSDSVSKDFQKLLIGLHS
ncbi:MAG TPA: glycosyltransferase [Bacteroidales bacterium]|jgi:glycosyltransferase involved in cell wall biosynthesis|nr:glycosyltransferase [Bacteroidales bacterium]